MANHLEGKVAVVTGASRGLGRAMSVAFATAGGKVALVARDAAKLAETAALCNAAGGEGVAFEANVASEADVMRTYEEFLAKLGSDEVVVFSFWWHSDCSLCAMRTIRNPLEPGFRVSRRLRHQRGGATSHLISARTR